MSKYGYLIDPFAKTVTEVGYSGDFRQIYSLIECETFDVARVNKHGDSIFIDDEGLIVEKPQAFFWFDGYPQPLAGKGLLLGSDSDGESVSPHVTLQEVKDRLLWVEPVRVDGEIAFIATGSPS
jgi:hypothetical protein